MIRNSYSPDQEHVQGGQAYNAPAENSRGWNSSSSVSAVPQPSLYSRDPTTPPYAPSPSQSRIPLRQFNSPSTVSLPSLGTAATPMQSVDSIVDADLAILEAEELELKLRLIQLRRQQVLARRGNITQYHASYLSVPSPAVATTPSHHVKDSAPDRTQSFDEVRSRESPQLPVTPSQMGGLTGKAASMPQHDHVRVSHTVTDIANSDMEASQGTTLTSHSATTGNRGDETNELTITDKSQPVDVHTSRTDFDPAKQALLSEISRSDLMPPSANKEVEISPSVRDIRRVGRIFPPEAEDLAHFPTEQLRSGRRSQSSHNGESHSTTPSTEDLQHELTQSRPTLTYDHPSTVFLEDSMQNVSSVANLAPSPAERSKDVFRDIHDAVVWSIPKTEDISISTPSISGIQHDIVLQNPQDESTEIMSSVERPPQLSTTDEELAVEMAEEEAAAFLQNGQLEDLHPMLKAQLAEAMKRHMPTDNLTGKSTEDEARSASDAFMSIYRDKHDFEPGPHIDPEKLLPPVPFHTNSEDVTETVQAENLSSGILPGIGKLVRPEHRSKHFKSRKKHDSINFQGIDLRTATPARDEDTCDCGKANLGTDECYFCWPCDGTIFCKECWDKCPPHKKRRFGAARTPGLPHEKSNPATARKIFETLQSDHTIEHQALLHVQDEDTSWFGAGKDEVSGDVVFQDFGRYSRLMAETSARYRRVRYPALVSFVGQTGAGKSSLIRLLVEALAPEDVRPQVPVVGSSLHADSPTSGDVHLYADMKTVGGEQPILYADCEGLDGGERQPMGARSRNKDTKTTSRGDRTQSFTKHIRKQHHTSEREILWANTPQKKSREYHVRHLYPRLLYTFSDVIVFVMKNPRVIENTIEQLLRWAAAALETSSNQPVLPHAIIVLNAYDNASDVGMWDVNNSTIDLMEKVGRAVHQNHSMRKFAEFWRERGKSIESVETLLLSYYSSVRVVRVPERGRPTLISEQVKKLYEEIEEACNRSRQSKHQVRMLLNSDELQPYLQYAFEHFSRNLDEPFDFVQASLANNPIPSNFGGHILKLAIDIMDLWKDKLDGPSIFKELSFMVASCIMLDSARHRTLGPAEKVIAAYVHFCDDALEKFCNRHWPCEYVHPNTAGRCVNVKAGHQSKGHQLKSGKVLAVGPYESDFTSERYQEFFQYCVVWNLRNLLDRLQEATRDSLHLELPKAAEIHRDEVLGHFFQHLQAPEGPKSFVSHTACYSCLIAPPEHALPCGHVLCTPCVQAFGTARGRCIVELTYCPLHKNDHDGQFNSRWPVFIKPHGAGVRILSLDGGGVRGIIELTILQQIEEALGVGLPVQAFFDLIIGTSTGGIIALGLGAHGWTTRKCTHHFERLCIKAFTKRKGIGFPGLEHIISFSNHSRYETTPLENALKDVFGDDQSLFAGLRDSLEDQAALQRLTKVGVVTVTTAGTVALLANYNRIDEEEGAIYQFHRSEKPSAELKTWQAARATSAAPTIFKPFAHDPSGQVYQDGALYYNCPVELAMREQRLIWPDMADSCPDIILSLGTGVNKNAKKPPPTRRVRLGLFNQLKNLTRIAIDKIHATLNSEQTWRTFVQQSNPPEHFKDRYIRLNLQLESDPPRMDDVSELRTLRDTTRNQFSQARESIKTVADRLLATAFYFALDQGPFTPEFDGDLMIVNGTILCRFAPGSSEIRSLGEALRRRSRRAYNENYGKHNPYFVVQQRRKEREARQIVLSTEAIDQMISDGIFEMEKIRIPQFDTRVETEILFCFGDKPGQVVMYPISGFPRYFMEEMEKVSRPRLVASPRSGPSHVFNLNWAVFEAKTSSWKFAAAEFLKSADPFKYYSSSDYKNPGNAASDYLLRFSERFSFAGAVSRASTHAAVMSRVVEEADGPSHPVEMSTERELLEDWTAQPPQSEDEVVRRQLIRLLLSRSSHVIGPPRLNLQDDPKLSNIGPMLAQNRPARPLQTEPVELPAVSFPHIISPNSPSNSGSWEVTVRVTTHAAALHPYLRRLLSKDNLTWD